MESIVIIGGGWLGKPLAQYLTNIGHRTTVSKTSQLGVDQLTQEQISAFPLNLATESADEITNKLRSTGATIAIGCFPPGFRKGKGEEYANQWKKLVDAAKSAGLRKIVMVSSTTVYPTDGSDMLESMATFALSQQSTAFSSNARIMLQAEQSVIDSGLDYAVVRCSGLVGPERHPSRFVSKLKQVSDLAPANMLHLVDAVGAVSFVTQLNENVVVNATTPNTTSKAKFYQAALDSVGSEESLPPVVSISDKRIVSNRLSELGYKFHFQHTLEIV